MRVFDNGSFFTVSVSRREVEAFKSSWPCSGLKSKAVSFQFDKRNGDLVDVSLEVDDNDGADGFAIKALADDAQNYGIKRLKLDKRS